MPALILGTLPAQAPPVQSTHTDLTGQPLFNESIKLRYEETRQFSGPRSKEVSTAFVPIYR